MDAIANLEFCCSFADDAVAYSNVSLIVCFYDDGNATPEEDAESSSCSSNWSMKVLLENTPRNFACSCFTVV